MSLSLLTNVASLEAQVNVNRTQSLLANSIERLSSGMRINHASDDAAGLAISSNLSAVIRGIAQAQRNTNDAVSMVQTAEGGLGEVNQLLTRMRELAVESANGGTLSSQDRQSINTEFSALQSEIDRIVQVTEYNGAALINGALSSGTSFQVGAMNSSNDVIALKLTNSDTTTLKVGKATVDVTTVANAQNALDAVSAAIQTVASQRASIGASQSRLAVAIDNLSTEYVNLSAANSRILDTDVADETATLTRNQILMQAGVSVLAQANQQPSAALTLLGR